MYGPLYLHKRQSIESCWCVVYLYIFDRRSLHLCMYIEHLLSIYLLPFLPFPCFSESDLIYLINVNVMLVHLLFYLLASAVDGLGAPFLRVVDRRCE